MIRGFLTEEQHEKINSARQSFLTKDALWSMCCAKQLYEYRVSLLNISEGLYSICAQSDNNPNLKKQVHNLMNEYMEVHKNINNIFKEDFSNEKKCLASVKNVTRGDSFGLRNMRDCYVLSTKIKDYFKAIFTEFDDVFDAFYLDMLEVME